MDILSTAAYVGPNAYAKLPLIRLNVGLRHRAGASVASFGPGLLERLVELVPPLGADVLPDGTRWVDHAARSEEVGLGELIARVALNLQRLAGSPTDFARSTPIPAPRMSRFSTATNPTRSGSKRVSSPAIS